MMREPEHNPELDEITTRLEAERPIPRPAFRGDLRRHLVELTGSRRPTPTRLRLAITAYAGSGTALLAVAAVGLAGVGPFGA